MNFTLHNSQMPSLNVTINAPELKAQSELFCRAASRAIAEITGKPESFVCVSLNYVDASQMCFGGSHEPCLLGTLTSIGCINAQNNANFQKKFTEIFGIAGDRMYISYVDIARENIGWNGKTFAS